MAALHRPDWFAREMGRVVREVRVGFGWSQRELGHRVGCSQSMVSRLEAGDLAHLDVVMVGAILDELGIRAWFDTRVPGLPDRRRQRDRVHARCAGFMGRHLVSFAWEVRHEVEVGSGRSRGWIDLLAYRRVDRALFCPELKTELHDAGAVQRTLGWYERESWAAARALGWSPRRMTSALILLCTEENDRRVADNSELISQAFPAGATALAAWLRDPTERMPPRAIAMVDPRSRRLDWLRPTRLHGRRSRAPYRDYADLASMLG